jgi:hypothetical protein
MAIKVTVKSGFDKGAISPEPRGSVELIVVIAGRPSIGRLSGFAETDDKALSRSC